MLNFDKYLYILAMQKIFSADQIINLLNIDTEEYVEVLKEFDRDVPKLEKYVKRNFTYKEDLQFAILTSIAIKGKEEGFNFERLSQAFRKTNKSSIISYINYTISNNIFLIPILFRSDEFFNDVKKLIEQQNVENVKNINTKKFRGNKEITGKLIELSNIHGIDEIAYILQEPIYIVLEELIFLKIGGYWKNENIRRNSNFVYTNSDKIGVEEILFIIDHMDEDIHELMRKLHLSDSKLNILLKDLKILVNEYGTELVKELILNKNMSKRYKYSELFQKIIRIRKGKLIEGRYSFLDFLSNTETNHLDSLVTKYLEYFENISFFIDSIRKAYVLVETFNDELIPGEILKEDEEKIVIEVNESIREINNDEIKIIRYQLT